MDDKEKRLTDTYNKALKKLRNAKELDDTLQATAEVVRALNNLKAYQKKHGS